MEVRDAPNWEFCSSSPTLTFDVRSSGAGIRGALITVSGVGWQLIAETDPGGVAQLTLDPQQVKLHGTGASPPSTYHLGSVNVAVAKTGWVGRQTRLWMVDCDGLIAAKLGAIARRNEILDRLAGYAALREIAAQIGRGRPTVDDLISGLTPPKPPRDRDLDRISQAADFLTRLEQLITDGGDVLPVSQILGIRPDDPEASAVLQQRIGDLWDGIASAAGQWSDRYGMPGDDQRP
jgi:hypothetical protein